MILVKRGRMKVRWEIIENLEEMLPCFGEFSTPSFHICPVQPLLKIYGFEGPNILSFCFVLYPSKRRNYNV